MPGDIALSFYAPPLPGPGKPRPPAPRRSAPDEAEEVAYLYRRAAECYSRGDRLEAGRLVRLALRLHPRDAGARHYLEMSRELLHKL